MADLVFLDKLPNRKTAPHDYGLGDTLTQLRQHPMKWAHVPIEGGAKSTLQRIASLVNTGKHPTFRDDFAASVRDGQLYLRFVGEEAADGETARQ